MGDGYDYTVRESKRARRVSLRMRRLEGLEIVVPTGFDRRLIPRVLDSHSAWIERGLTRGAKEQALMPPEPPGGRPTEIELAALGEAWRANYRPTDSERVRVLERPPCELLVSGRVEDVAASRAALRTWLRRRAQATLVPWLEAVAIERGFTFGKSSIRMQKTRWGSCSSRGTITLNAKSLFLPSDTVDYLLLHELCHTVHPNHSAAFYALLETHVPDSARCRRALSNGWRYVPRWAEE